MEIIPCVTLKKINLKNFFISEKDISSYIKEGEKLYILDLDGIEKNRQNLEFYQKISLLYDLWIDCGPRNIGDVVDIFMTGATSITIRRQFYPLLNLSDIRDISENKVYLNIDFQDYKNFNNLNLFLKDYDGFVNFKSKEEIEGEIYLNEYINKLHRYNKIYCYENNVKNYIFWKRFDLDGLIIDIKKIKEFKNAI